MTFRLCYTGAVFDFDDLFAGRPVDIRLADIAHHLALDCRYGGAVRKFYSVAEHSILAATRAAELAFEMFIEDWRMVAKLALFHDAEETYLQDRISPIKKAENSSWYREATALTREAIFAKFEIYPTVEAWDLVHRIDRELLTLEREQLMPPLPANVLEWPPGDPAPHGYHCPCYAPEIAEIEFHSRCAAMGIQ